MDATTRGMGRVGWALRLVLPALWGGSFFFGKAALAELPPFTTVFVQRWLRPAAPPADPMRPQQGQA